MPTTKWTYGVRVTTSNNKLDFKAGAAGTVAATLRLGDYTLGQFAAEVQRAMRAAGVGNETCTYNFTGGSAGKFTLTGVATFQLLFGTGANAASDCNGLLGFTANDETGNTTYSSDDTVGTASGTFETAGVYAWTPVDPPLSFTPVTAAADGSAASLLQRHPRTAQQETDGGLRESIYYSTDKLFRITYQALMSTNGPPSEQTHFFRLMAWLEQGAPVNYQPDTSSANALRLVLSNPGDTPTAFSYLTRTEIEVGELVLIEQLSRT